MEKYFYYSFEITFLDKENVISNYSGVLVEKDVNSVITKVMKDYEIGDFKDINKLTIEKLFEEGEM